MLKLILTKLFVAVIFLSLAILGVALYHAKSWVAVGLVCLMNAIMFVPEKKSPLFTPWKKAGMLFVLFLLVVIFN